MLASTYLQMHLFVCALHCLLCAVMVIGGGIVDYQAYYEWKYQVQFHLSGKLYKGQVMDKTANPNEHIPKLTKLTTPHSQYVTDAELTATKVIHKDETDLELQDRLHELFLRALHPALHFPANSGTLSLAKGERSPGINTCLFYYNPHPQSTPPSGVELDRVAITGHHYESQANMAFNFGDCLEQPQALAKAREKYNKFEYGSPETQVPDKKLKTMRLSTLGMSRALWVRLSNLTQTFVMMFVFGRLLHPCKS